MDFDLSIFDVPRVVKPRKQGYRDLPIVAVDLIRRRAIVESTGEIVGTKQLPDLLAGWDSEAIVCCCDPQELIRQLESAYVDRDDFQWRASIVQREYGSWTNDPDPLIVEETIFSYFGFKRRSGHERGRWYHLLDPVSFFGEELQLQDLLAWGQDVRSFCRENDLPIRPTAAGIAGLLLRDRRFWPEPRRKVPKSTNEAIRDALPGNYYKANCVLDYPHKAIYLDQIAAHHAAAASVAFPLSDDLYGRGCFDTIDDPEPWISGSDPELETIASQYGVLLVDLDVPIRRIPDFPLPMEEKGSGSRRAFIYTNELDWIRSRGIKISSVYAAWTSATRDHGLNAYAAWSLQQLRDAPASRRTWLKRVLLSAYGLLAARPRKQQTVWRQGIGEEIQIAGVIGHVREAKKETQIPIANVVQRGMIEAEVRRRSIEIAEQIAGTDGHDVLAIYADGILYTGTPMIPPAGWEIEGRSERLYVIDDVSIVAADTTTIVKLPGRHGAVRDELLRRYQDAKEARH